jgi:hypothetical protein
VAPPESHRPASLPHRELWLTVGRGGPLVGGAGHGSPTVLVLLVSFGAMDGLGTGYPLVPLVSLSFMTAPPGSVWCGHLAGGGHLVSRISGKCRNRFFPDLGRLLPTDRTYP